MPQFDVTDTTENWKGHRLNGQRGDWALDLSVKDECKNTGVKKFQHFMGPEGSLPCSQEPTTALP
jgi:hypothetical protein